MRNKSVERASSDAAFSYACLCLLHAWALHAEEYWYALPALPADPQLGCYGSGYNAWGVQTNQKYVGAMATLAAFGEEVASISAQTCAQARERALSALRFSLRSHLSGDAHCTDGTQWGHTWISGLGIERMLYGVHLLEPHLTDGDGRALRRVLTSEADWLLHHHTRGAHVGVFGDPWNHSGKNVPESNLWNGAILWRAGVNYPDHPHADAWREEAHRFLMNAVSVPADATDERMVAGRPVREWHAGANFFANYALDHHGYLNVGYMVICLSNAAMLHFDMLTQGVPSPESLYHHQSDLWQVVRRLVFSDGRLARAGGDTRVRYAYCQEYLLPALVFAADRLGEAHAEHLIQAQLDLIQREADWNGDGSFYGRRLAPLAERSPYYYTRLESDRACALGMLAAYLQQLKGDETPSVRQGAKDGAKPGGAIDITPSDFETSVAGHWFDPDHGVVLHRGPSRLASFAWRAQGLAQGLCQPPDDGHLAEWWQNLGGVVRFLNDDPNPRRQARELVDYDIDLFDGGFLTSGRVMEGVGLTLAEGWHGSKSAQHQIAFVALPDGHTVLGFQHCRTAGHRTYLAEVKGLHLNLPNDLYNGFRRRLHSAAGELVLESPPESEQLLELGGAWVAIDDRLGVVGLYGAGGLTVHRSPLRRGGPYRSLYVEELCWHCGLGTRAVDPHRVILDVGWAVLSDADAQQTGRFAERCEPLSLVEPADVLIRGACVQGLDGRTYLVLVNFDVVERVHSVTDLIGATHARDLVTREAIDGGADGMIRMEPCQARICVLKASY